VRHTSAASSPIRVLSIPLDRERAAIFVDFEDNVGGGRDKFDCVAFPDRKHQVAAPFFGHDTRPRAPPGGG
jgi:hypothetical protein